MGESSVYTDVSRQRVRHLAECLPDLLGSLQEQGYGTGRGMEPGSIPLYPTLPQGSLLQSDETQTLHQESGALSPMGEPRHQRRELVLRGGRMAVLSEREADIG